MSPESVRLCHLARRCHRSRLLRFSAADWERPELGEGTKTIVSASLTEASFYLTTRDVVMINDIPKPIERRIELVSKVQIIVTVRNEDAKFSSVRRGGATVRLLQGEAMSRRNGKTAREADRGEYRRA
jgi:hypothetical protein